MNEQVVKLRDYIFILNSLNMDDVTNPNLTIIQADILIPQDKLQDFFFLDEDEEQDKYGHNSKQVAIALSGSILKEKAKDEVSTIPLLPNYR